MRSAPALTRRGARAQSDAAVVATQPEAAPAVRSRPRKLSGDSGRRGGSTVAKKKAANVAPAPAPAEAPAVAPAPAEAPAEAEAEAEAEAPEADVGADDAAPPAAAKAALPARGAYRFTAADVDGTPHPLAEYAGKARAAL